MPAPIPTPDTSQNRRNDRPAEGPGLRERTLYVPRMSFGASRCFSAALRGFGLDAHPFPASDDRTLELGGRFTSGEECFPERVTLGDVLKLVLEPGARRERLAFFMPTAPGPCRFGQYAPFLRRTLDSVGATEVMVLSPHSGSGYDELGADAADMQRAAWRGLASADLLRKALLRIRPYERTPGDADQAYETGLSQICRVLEQRSPSMTTQLQRLQVVMERAAAAFRSIPTEPRDRVLIGVVGEIFCRLNTFSNEDLVRQLEAQGGEAWIADIGEWVYYTNQEQRRKWIPQRSGRLSGEAVRAWIKDAVQRRDEHALARFWRPLFAGREEPSRISVVTDLAEPYLPSDGVYGEMVINAGKTVYLWSKGCDGIVDISPFTCMNGIVSEAIYPKISRDHDGIPIRIFYFDGTQSHLDRDLGIFLELARTYRKRKSAAVPRA